MPHSPPERLYDLSNGHNFRDMGGYPTRDGRRTRWNTLYRSGVMSSISSDDALRLQGLGIATICDFRTNDERMRSPTSWHQGTATELVERDHGMSAGALHTLIARADVSADDVSALMKSIYRELPFEQIPSYRNLFLRLAEGRIPLVFNCSAGKDRTGIAAALLLESLGVDRHIIQEDYLLTNICAPELIMILEREPGYGEFVQRSPDIAMPLIHADATYLDAMFDAVEETSGSVHSYLTKHLGLSDGHIERMRTLLLEPVEYEF